MKRKILKLTVDIALIALILANFYILIRDKDLIRFVALMFGFAVYIGLEITMKIKKKEKTDLQNQIKDLEEKIKDLENQNQDYRTGLRQNKEFQKLEERIKELSPKYYNQKNLIEALWEEKGIIKRYNILKQVYYEKYTRKMDYYSENFIKEIMEEILLMLDTSEKQNEIIKGELNLQVSTNYLLTKEIEELKKINNRT